MVEVGIRELWNALSRYLARVRRGETFLVTDRGRQVARIVPQGSQRTWRSCSAKAARGGRAPVFRPPEQVIELRPGAMLSEYISEERL